MALLGQTIEKRRINRNLGIKPGRRVLKRKGKRGLMIGYLISVGACSACD